MGSYQIKNILLFLKTQGIFTNKIKTKPKFNSVKTLVLDVWDPVMILWAPMILGHSSDSTHYSTHNLSPRLRLTLFQGCYIPWQLFLCTGISKMQRSQFQPSPIASPEHSSGTVTLPHGAKPHNSPWPPLTLELLLQLRLPLYRWPLWPLIASCFSCSPWSLQPSKPIPPESLLHMTEFSSQDETQP